MFAGLGDVLSRPVESLSIYQCGSLAVSGMIWTRYALVITPKNWSFFAVNLFMSTLNWGQIARIAHYNMAMEKSS